MPVSGDVHAEQDEILRQIDRMVSSNVLQGSESLCKLLRFLTEKSLESPATPLKEYEIATQVFGRPSYFDPRLDSTVRVQTGRLRSKLAEYYAGPGAEDALLIEIPKGAYAVTLHARVKAITLPSSPAPAEPPPPALPLALPQVIERAASLTDFSSRKLLVAMAVISTALAVSVLLLVYILSMRRPAPLMAAEASPSNPALKLFWSGFTDEQEYPWAVFSNAEFIGKPETGMRYFNPATDSKDAILDHYSGVGEVIAIHELDRLFTSFHHGLLVKRGRLLSLDDAKNHDLIFVGSPSENLPLREIQTAQEFVFRRVDLPGHKNALVIVNVHAAPKEQSVFAASQGLPLTEDYSIVALVPGMNASRLVLVLAGITTLGTQGAVEYVCRADNVQQLLQRLPGFAPSKPVPFEALLRVRVKQGVPVAEELVALRPRPVKGG